MFCDMHLRCRHQLRWISHRLAKTLGELGIHTRKDLAKYMGWPVSTTYRAFNPDWSGVAQDDLLAEISGRLRLPISELAESVPTEPITGLSSNKRDMRRIR